MSAVSESRIQFFAVRVEHVRDRDERADMWLWFGDALTPIEKGAYAVADSGLLDFQPNNEAEDSDGSARR